MSIHENMNFPEPAIFSIGENLKLSNLSPGIILKILKYMEENSINGYIVIYADYIYRDMFNQKFQMEWMSVPKNLQSRLTSKIGWFFVKDEKDEIAKIRVVLGPLRDYNEILILENPDNGKKKSGIFAYYHPGIPKISEDVKRTKISVKTS